MKTSVNPSAMTRLILAVTLAGLAALAFFLIATENAGAQGIGVYPSVVDFQDALRSGEYFQSIGVVNNAETERRFSIVGGGEIGDWISFVDIQDRTQVIETVAAPPRSQAQAWVRIQVPDNTANGLYTGTVRVQTASATLSGEGGGAAISVGADLDVKVTVTGTQNIQGSLVDVQAIDIEEGSPIRVVTTVRNTGNVRVEPEVRLELVNDQGTMVEDEKFTAAEPALPDSTSQLQYELASTSHQVGEYTARVSVNVGEIDFGAAESRFSILPVGTLTRRGALRELDLVIEPKPGDFGKLNVLFLNTGQIDTLAKFTGELYHQDRLVGVLTSEEILVQVGEQKALPLLFEVGEEGEYQIIGKVNYQGKETEEQRINFTVAPEEVAVSAGPEEASDPIGTSPAAGGNDMAPPGDLSEIPAEAGETPSASQSPGSEVGATPANGNPPQAAKSPYFSWNIIFAIAAVVIAAGVIALAGRSLLRR